MSPRVILWAVLRAGPAGAVRRAGFFHTAGRLRKGESLKRKPLFYGYIVAFSSILVMFAVWGLGNHPLSLYVVPLTEQYGFSRAAFSLVFSIINLFTAFGNLLFGTLDRKVGIKKLMLLGAILCVGAYALFYFGGGLVVFYIAAALFGISIAFTTNNPLSVLVNNWFLERRGFILGLIFAASGLGGTVGDVVVGRLQAIMPYQAALGVTACAIAVLLAVALVLLRETPASMGLSPYGTAAAAAAAADADGLPFSQAVHCPSFWLLLLTEVLWGISIIPVMTCIPAYLSDRGFADAYVSGVVMASLYGISAVAKLSMGMVSDRWGPGAMVGILSAAATAGMLLLVFVQGELSALGISLCIGIAFSCMTVPAPLLTSHIFGKKAFSALLGVFTASLTFAGAAATPLVNLVYDVSGSYIPAFLFQAAAFLLSGITGVLAVRLRPRSPQHAGTPSQ